MLVVLAAIFHLPIKALNTTVLVLQVATMVFHGVTLLLMMQQIQIGEIVYLVSFARIRDHYFQESNL